MKQNNLFVIVFMLLFSISCSSPTKITSSWQDPDKNVNINNLQKILVVAMFKTTAANRLAEDQMAAYLNGKAVVSYNYLDMWFNKLNVEALREKISKDDFDGAITMRLIDVDRERVYKPGSINTYPNYYRNFSTYYYNSWNNYATPGYYVTTKTFTVEVNVYSVKEDKIIWTGVTKTTNPGGVERLTGEVAKVVYKYMVKKGFVSKQVTVAST